MNHRTLFNFICISVLCAFFAGMASPWLRASDDAYQAEIKAWQQQRLQRLKTPDGWLSLCGLFWLQPGANTFGAASDNTLVLKASSAPAHIGTFTLTGGAVHFKLHADALTTAKDMTIGMDMVLVNDTAEKPSILKFGPVSCVLIKRGDKLGIRVRDAQNPRIHALDHIDTFPIDPAWRIPAVLKRYTIPVIQKTPTIIGTLEEQPCPGVLEFTIQTKLYRLYPQGTDGDLFVIFADASNGKETYGSGRFLTVKKPDANGHTLIDFNQAYNPPCAFSPYATCPLPPVGNTLALAISAGEKRVTGMGH